MVTMGSLEYYENMAAQPEAPLPTLLPGETLVSVTEVSDPAPRRLPSGLRELQRLAGADKLSDIGEFGPVLASLSIDSSEKSPEKHLYEVVFGRDSLRSAIDLIEFYPRLARSTLVTLAENQGVEFNEPREEEPGRIPHEIRDPKTDERARELTKQLGWGWPYYGEVDGTPEFIRTLAEYCRLTSGGKALWEYSFTGRDGEQHIMADAFIAAVDWIERRLNSNKEGLLEYKRTNPNGIANQVWKDSGDSYFHADGVLANHDQGIASVEVQRVAYDALLDAAELWEKNMGDRKRAEEMQARAESLKRTIIDVFWTDERGGYFVLGTDRNDNSELQPMKIKTSNMGHLLKGRLLSGDDPEMVQRREVVIRQLFSKEMLGLNGVRTLASDEIRYRPGSYHDGSVWIWDNYVISQGLSQQGYHGLAHYLNDKLLDDINSTRRFPEFLRGDDDPNYRLNTRIVKVFDHKNNFENTLEQPPQDIQAWSVAAIVALKLRRARGQHETVGDRKRKFEQDILASIA